MPLTLHRLRVPIVSILIAAATTFLASACSPSDPDPASTANATGVNKQPPAASTSAHLETYAARTATGTALDELELLRESWSGDLDGMIERDVIRALVPVSKTFYFLDGGDQRLLLHVQRRRVEGEGAQGHERVGALCSRARRVVTDLRVVVREEPQRHAHTG